ncbi:hypothetical protein TNCV_3586771 [Trichonephila clavipes]|nr:hypothetical protein TNCV_3586771 [Trichonephila clavipes]
MLCMFLPVQAGIKNTFEIGARITALQNLSLELKGRAVQQGAHGPHVARRNLRSGGLEVDKSDHSCPEAVTGLCRYHHSTPPPVSQRIGERTKYLLSWRTCDLLLLHQMSATTFAASSECGDFAALRESDDFACCVGQGHHCRRLEPASYGFVSTLPLDKSDHSCPEAVTGL